MKRLLLCWILGIGVLASGCQSPPAPEVEVDVLNELHERAFAALLEGDTGTLERLWAPDWVFSAPDGRTISRAGFLELFETGAIRYDSIADLEAEARTYGDAAVILGTVRIWYTSPDGPHEEHLRYTTIYARGEGPWQMEVWQSTLIEGGA